MNVIVFSKRWERARQYELTHPRVIAAVAGLVLVAFATVFYAGWRLGASPEGVAVAGGKSNEIRPEVQDKLNALASRIGQMNAHVIRLDALGKRITEMAKLDKGEFNFEQEPAQGGPEVDLDEAPVVTPQLNSMLDRLLKQIQNREQQLTVLENLIATRNLNQQIIPHGRPVSEGWISSYFGRRSDPFTGHAAFHKGLDFAGPEGSTVTAVAAGVVTWAADRSGYGNLVEINHGNGYVTRYGHNEKLLVKVGDKVEKGQSISLIGSTGRSTGPHVHFEVLKNGSAIDPMRFVGKQTEQDKAAAKTATHLFSDES